MLVRSHREGHFSPEYERARPQPARTARLGLQANVADCTQELPHAVTPHDSSFAP